MQHVVVQTIIRNMSASNPPRSTAIGFFNLEAAAEAIELRGGHRDLVGAIRNYAAAHSATLDLKRADRLQKTFHLILATASELGPVESDNEKHFRAGAIFEAAILAYARATHTGSEVRNRTPIAERLPAELKPTHLRVVDLRDHAIAHHGRAEWTISRPWADEVSVFSIYEQQIEVDFFSNRANWMASALHDLAALVPTAIRIGKTLTNERTLQLMTSIKKYENDPDWHDAIAANPFLPSTYFRDERGLSQFFERANYVDRTHLGNDPHAADVTGRNAWPRPARKRK